MIFLSPPERSRLEEKFEPIQTLFTSNVEAILPDLEHKTHNNKPMSLLGFILHPSFESQFWRPKNTGPAIWYL